MAHNTIHFSNPDSGELCKAPVGFAWTVLFWNIILPLARFDLKGACLMIITLLILFFVPFMFGLVELAVILSWFINPILWSFLYNKFFINGLVKKGFQAYRTDHGDLHLLVNKLDSSIPIVVVGKHEQLKGKPKTLALLEMEFKKANSETQKISILDTYKNLDLINDEEYKQQRDNLS